MTLQPHSIEKHYRDLLPLYQEFTVRLHDLLSGLLANVDIHLDHIEQRVKTLKSFCEKVEDKAYTDDPFGKIKDIAGLRVVVYYQEEVETVKDLLQREFVIDEDHSIDKSGNLEADRFGYRSLHLIVSLSASRSALEEWKRFRGLCAEIQVRSILQHAWAVFSRQLDYKVPSQAPDKIRRRLFALSAQLEAADDEISRIYHLSHEIIRGTPEEIQRIELAHPLNLDSLKDFMEHQVAPKTWDIWEQLGITAGMEPQPPFASRFHETGLQILLHTLQASGISTMTEFEELLPALDQQTAPLKDFVSHVTEKGGVIHAVPIDVLILLVSFANAGDIPPDFDWWGKYDAFFIETLRDVLAAIE